VGPWNGGLQSPTTFPEIMSADSGWLYKIRGAARLFDRLFQCTSRAASVLSATKATDESLPGIRTVRMIENGVDLNIFWPSPASAGGGILRVVFAGRLIPAKGVSMLLEAVSRLRSEIPLCITIIGDGRLRQALQQETAARGLTDIVQFTGALPLPEVARHMRQADLFCLPSVRESGGAVLLESLASGVPVTAVGQGGPAARVDDEVGRTRSAAGREPLIRDLMNVFADAWRNPAEWQRKGTCGRARAERNYGWDARIETALGLYKNLAEGRPVNA
jgi:glycosyltransferase involved in cell wall biosynthesis